MFFHLLPTVYALSFATINYKIESALTGSTESSGSANLPETLDLSLDSTQKLYLTTKMDVPYLSLVLEDVINSFAVTFRAKQKGGVQTIKIDLSNQNDLNRLRVPGPKVLMLYAGNEKETSKHLLGSIELDFVSTAADEFSPLPEITHTFKPDVVLPDARISYIFTGLTLAPWLLLISLWYVLGANVSLLFTSVGYFTNGLVFMGCLVAHIFLYYLYWTRLNVFQLIAYGTVLSLFTTFFGRSVLVSKSAMK